MLLTRNSCLYIFILAKKVESVQQGTRLWRFIHNAAFLVSPSDAESGIDVLKLHCLSYIQPNINISKRTKPSLGALPYWFKAFFVQNFTCRNFNHVIWKIQCLILSCKLLICHGLKVIWCAKSFSFGWWGTNMFIIFLIFYHFLAEDKTIYPHCSWFSLE